MADTSYVKTSEMSRSEWLKARQRGIGASEVAAVLGISKYKTPLEVYAEKTAETIDEQPMNAAMEFGLRLEDVVAEKFMEETGLSVRRDNKIRIHPEHDFLFCNLDRTIVAIDDRGPGILEIKTASGFAVKEWETEIPVPYFMQIQHQFAVTGYKWGYFALLIDGREFRVFPVERSDEFIEEQTQALVSWWNNHVVLGIPPAPLVRDLEGMPTQPESVVEVTVDVMDAYSQLCEVKEEIKGLEAKKESFEARIKEHMGVHEVLALDGRPLCTWKTSKPSQSFDSKRFKKEQPALFAQYALEKAGSRRFVVKGESDQ